MIAPALVQRVVQLPGAVVSKCALEIGDDATDEQLGEIGVALATMGGAVAWWLGDYGLELQERKGADYRAGRASILGIDEGYWANCVMICRFFKASCRHEALSHSHHYEACRAAGGAATGSVRDALRWLKRAQEEGWAVSKMREMVNRSLATSHKPGKPAEENYFEPLDEADKWAHQHVADQLEPGAAKKLLVRFSEIINYIDRLKAAASA